MPNILPLQVKPKYFKFLGSAHVGAQTRQDLPIDDEHFSLKNFTTTTKDAYKPTQIDRERIIYGAKRSQLQFGDMGSTPQFQTVQSSTYVPHYISPVHLMKTEYKQSCIFNPNNYAHDVSNYTSTQASAFSGIQPSASQKDYRPLVDQRNGHSHLSLGQSRWHFV